MPAAGRVRRHWGAGHQCEVRRGRPPRQSPPPRLPLAYVVRVGAGVRQDWQGPGVPGLLLSPARGARSGQRARGQRAPPGWRQEVGRRNTGASCVLPAPLTAPGPGGRGDPCLPAQGGLPQDLLPWSPFPGPFVPGKADAPSAAALASRLPQRQLSQATFSPHNGVRTRPPPFGTWHPPTPRFG